MLTPAQRELQTAVHQGRKRGDLWCGLGEALAKGSSSIRFNTSHFHFLSRSGCVVLSTGRVWQLHEERSWDTFFCGQAKWIAAALLNRELVASSGGHSVRIFTRTTITGWLAGRWLRRAALPHPSRARRRPRKSTLSRRKWSCSVPATLCSAWWCGESTIRWVTSSLPLWWHGSQS